MSNTTEIRERQLERCLRLFLSADIVGSTAYKNKGREKGSPGRRVQPWLETFYRFFEDLPFAFRNRYPVGNGDLPLSAPRLWKTLGDEVVFETVLLERQHAAEHLRHFCDTLQDYRPVLRAADPELDIKGTAWLAGFPVGNSLVYLSDVSAVKSSEPAPEADGSESVIPTAAAGKGDQWDDYIGPSMDIGFRLKDFANPRRIAVSVELAYLLAAGEDAEGNEECDLSLYLADAHTMKGVIQNIPYPAFWIECDSGETADTLIALEKPLRQTAKREATREFCREFILKHSPPLFLPFIGCDPKFSNTPPGYERDLEEIKKVWEAYHAAKNEPALEPRDGGEAKDTSNDYLLEIFREVFGRTPPPPGD